MKDHLLFLKQIIIIIILFSGAMPLWMLGYSFFLPHLYEEISFPFYHIAGALGAIACPVLVGAAVQRCVPKTLPHLDKAIHPTCLLVTLTAATVGSYSIWQVWSLVTWPLLIGSCFMSFIGCLIGALTMVTVKRKLSLIKTVSIATTMHNTLLVTIIQQTSYPAAQASIMHTTIVCIEWSSLCFMYLLYIIHLMTWTASPHYRSLHDSIGLSGVYKSIAEKIVQSMIKAGEISFRDNQEQQPNPCLQRKDKACPDSEQSGNITSTSSTETNSLATTATHGFCPLGIKNRIFSTSFESMRRLSRDVSYPLNHESVSDESTMSSLSDLERVIKVDIEECDSPNPSSSVDIKQSESDSLSIDYEMLNKHGKGMKRTSGSGCQKQSYAEDELQSTHENDTINASSKLEAPFCEMSSDSGAVLPSDDEKRPLGFPLAHYHAMIHGY
jgi:hypothetical protein